MTMSKSALHPTGDAAQPLPNLAPAVSAEAETYWREAAEHRLMLQRCDSCQAVVWYPRAICPQCGSQELSWFQASGRGEIYSYTVIRRGRGEFQACSPYVLAYVELEEGPRVLTNVVTADLGSVHIGQAVRAVFHDTGQGSALVRFTPC